MKAYVGFKFKEDHSDRAFIEHICSVLEEAGFQTVVTVRDHEKWGEAHMAPEALMQIAFKSIDECSLAVIEFSEKGVGLGIEAGYAFAKGKPVIVIAHEGSEVSETLRGIAQKIIFYKEAEDLREALKSSAIIDA